MFFGAYYSFFPCKDGSLLEAESGKDPEGRCLFPLDAFISDFKCRSALITVISPGQVMFESRLTPFIVSSFAEIEIQAC